MIMILYRSIEKDDIGQIIRLLLVMHAESPAYAEYDPDPNFVMTICNHIIENDQFSTVACDGSNIIGIMLGHIANLPFVTKRCSNEIVLYVRPDYRDGKIGVKMIRQFEAWTIAQGVDLIATGVSADISADKVDRLYVALGFVASGSNFHKHLN